MTAPNTYYVGQLVSAAVAFVDEDAAPVDPGTVSVKYRSPDGTVTTKVYGTDAAVIKDSTGNYHIDISATAKGIWRYRWFSTGTGQAAGEQQFTVIASAMD